MQYSQKDLTSLAGGAHTERMHLVEFAAGLVIGAGWLPFVHLGFVFAAVDQLEFGQKVRVAGQQREVLLEEP